MRTLRKYLEQLVITLTLVCIITSFKKMFDRLIRCLTDICIDS